MNRYFTLASADLVVPNQDAWHLMWDFQTLREIIDNVGGSTPYVSSRSCTRLSYLAFARLQNQALVVANEIINTFKKGDPSTVNKCRKIVERVFGKDWQAKGADIYDEGDKSSAIWGIGTVLALIFCQYSPSNFYS